MFTYKDTEIIVNNVTRSPGGQYETQQKNDDAWLILSYQAKNILKKGGFDYGQFKAYS